MSSVKRRQIVNAIFEVTGEKVGESDPVVTASLYFAHEIRSAGVEASERIHSATMGALIAARKAEAACAAVGADQGKFMRELRGIVRPGESLASSAASVPSALSRRPLVTFVAGAVSVSLLAFAAGVLDFSGRDEAALGRAFKRALPTLEPELKAKLLEHMKKSVST